MLYAELHGKLGKLDPNSPDLERSEDILTSTTFGTLLVAGAVDLLVAWLNCARHLDANGTLDEKPLDVIDGAPRWWFWPNLNGTIPDVVLRIGSRLFVIEAKYGSTKGGAGSPCSADPAQLADQLLREWSVIQPTARGLPWYPLEIREAIETCDHQLVYLVSARSRTAITELCESQHKIRREQLPDPSLWLLTWQDLHAVLKHEEMARPATRVWVDELAQLLDERRQLKPFLGFSDALSAWKAPSSAVEAWARQWRQRESADIAGGLQRIDLGGFHQAVTIVESWADDRQNAARLYFDRLGRVDWDGIRRVVEFEWRPPDRSPGRQARR